MDQPNNASSQSPSGNSENQPQKGNKFMSALIGIIVAVVAGAYVMMNKKQSSTTQNSSENAKTTPEAGTSIPEEPWMEGGGGEEEPAVVPPTTPIAPEATAPATFPSSETVYKDGTYAAVGDYLSPGGPEQVGVSVTLKDGIIIDSSIEVKATRPISKDKQTIFSQNYKQFVIGKNIDEVVLTKVSSSSLTPKGFNEALEEIKAGARS